MRPLNVFALIKGLGLKEGETKRLNCPMCGGEKTFTATKDGGDILWNCFKDNCNLKGSSKIRIETSDLKKRLAKPVSNEYNGKFELLPRFTNITSKDGAIEWLRKYNSYDAVANGKIPQVKYDPKLDRVIFVCKDFQGNIRDAIGRPIINKKGKSKWHKYGRSGLGFLALYHGWSKRELTEGVALVEDALSACSVSRAIDGYALLGSKLTDEMFKEIVENYEFVLLLLDPDAISTAMKLKRRLDPHVETHIVELPDDPKNLSKEELLGMLNEWKVSL